MFNMTTFARHS